MVTDDYIQTADGALNIELGGLVAGDDHDVLDVGDIADLDGTLNITLIDSFSPQLGDSFVIMTFASSVGDFATYNGLNLGGGLELEPSFTATSLTLTVVQP